ncbi:EscU/YscU/HrcU family type III secretion system export apparatus switch protein [Ramlibacter sp. MAHUQ-53]|uniref:EscU/YscU/HrcU family type III secretion system export apparatus switch protein n=1 Tax=unclassified Ramlibacter TaxID=2617605 RepID=UPI003645D0E7
MARMKPPLREAVALAYGHRATPVVTARGRDEVAERIVEEARRQGVHVAEDPALLALLSQVDIDQQIPQEAYTAVAVVLSWVYWLKGMEPGDEKRPARF